MILSISINPAIDKVYEVSDFNVGRVYRPDAMTSTAGGKGLNVARVISQLEENVMVTGFVGGDNGKWIIKEIQNLGIDTFFLETNKETRVCLAIVDRKCNTSTEVLEKGLAIDPSELEDFIALYKELVSKADIITASGSLSPGIPNNIYKRLVEIAKEHNKKFILDTSGHPLKDSINSLPYMVKPNLDEIKTLFGYDILGTGEQLLSVAQLKRMGIHLPCLTLGGDGCIAALQDGIYHFRGPKVDVLSPVGSGDSFVAGAAVALQKGWNEIDVIKLGMACGIANTQFFKTGNVSKELVEHYFKLIRYEKLA